MRLKLNEGRILVCGDSETDLPMLDECLACSSRNVFTIWVTSNEQLREKVRAACNKYGNDHYVFVSCPEVRFIFTDHFLCLLSGISPYVKIFWK